MKTKHVIGYVIMLILIAIVLIMTACGNTKRYNVLYTRHIGTTQIKAQSQFVAENASEAIQKAKYSTWQNCDSIKINYVYEVRR